MSLNLYDTPTICTYFLVIYRLHCLGNKLYEAMSKILVESLLKELFNVLKERYDVTQFI